MDIELTLSDCTLSTEDQAVVNAVNRFLARLPDDQDPEAARRLAMEFLEAADVAPQASLARAIGLHQARSVRFYNQRLRMQGLAGLFDRPIPGRPAVTTQAPVEQAVLQVIVDAVLTAHRLPSDAELAAQVTQVLGAGQVAAAAQVTSSMVETIRLRWGLHRAPAAQRAPLTPDQGPPAPMPQAEPSQAPEPEPAAPTPALPPALPPEAPLAESAAPAPASQTRASVAPPPAAGPASAPPATPVRLGQTRIGGAFILAILLVEAGWLKLAHLLPMAPHYAVTATQWLLTALFAVIFEVPRAFHLDDVCDIGFALVTGRPRPLTHGTFQHLLWAIPAAAAQAFYAASAAQAVQGGDAETRRVSLDGHNLPRYTRLVPVSKGKIGNTGRILPAEELELAFDLDAHLWLALRVYQGTKKLTQGLLALVSELLQHRGPQQRRLRLFFDKGGYQGGIFRDLAAKPDVDFYTPAVRYADNVAQWEKLPATAFDPAPFVYAKAADRPADQRPTYRLADTEMTLNVREGKAHQVVATVTLRAIVLHDPLGQKPAERWPLVLLTDDRASDARTLLNEYGDHWGQEFGHRIGRHDLALDILPPGYVLTTTRDAQGNLQREVEYDQTAFFLTAWLRCLVFNLLTRFAQALGGAYTKLWAGTLLRKFIRRSATLYLVGAELHVVFDPFPEQAALQPLLDELNAKRTALPWLNNLVVQFRIAHDELLYPLTEPQKRKRLFGDG